MYETQGHDVVINETRSRLLPIGICLFGTALGVGLLLYGVSLDETFALAVGVLVTVILLPATMYLVHRALRNQPALVIGEHGFTDAASIAGGPKGSPPARR